MEVAFAGHPVLGAAFVLALGIRASQLPVEVYDNGLLHVFVVLGTLGEVAALAPDLRQLARLPQALGVNVAAGSGRRWKTRMFAPAGGIAEDAAAGSTAGPLAVHLAPTG